MESEYFEIDENGVLIEYHGTDTDVVIPKSVTIIVEFAFYNCSSLQSITISEGVKEIGEYAFSHCSSLQSITISEGVKEIGNYAFSACSSLQSVTIPKSVESIGIFAFSDCSSLQTVNIPESVKEIDGGIFCGCRSLEIINGPFELSNGLIIFKNKPCLYACLSHVQHVVIPEKVQEIEEFAFSDCSSLQTITIPKSVTIIGKFAFYNCSSLQSITISEGVKEIGNYAFDECSSLQSIFIPGSVILIGEEAFARSSLRIVEMCSSLSSLVDSFRGIKDIFGDNRPAIWCGADFSLLSGDVAKSCHAYGYAYVSARGETIDDSLSVGYREYISQNFKSIAKGIGDRFYDDAETLAWIVNEGLLSEKLTTEIAVELSKRGHVEAAAIVLNSVNSQLSMTNKQYKGLEL